MLGRVSFWKCCGVGCCLCDAWLPWCCGGGGWIIDWAKGLRESRRMKERRRRTGCSWQVLRVRALSLSSLHTLYILSRGNRNKASLTACVWTSPLFVHWRFVLLLFWVVQTIGTQLCPGPFWAICYCEALSKCSHALLLPSAPLAFSWDDFLWQTEPFDSAHLS